MTLPTLNGKTVLRATLSVPGRGVWTALVSVEAEDTTDLTEGVDLVLGDATWRGFARRVGARHGRVEFLVVGGAGGLERELDARYYADAQARIPLGDLMRETGETLSNDVGTDVTGTMLARWTRPRGRAGLLLGDLARVLGTEWRILADGTVWLGAETWPEVELEHDVVADNPAHDQADLAVDAPTLTPGVVLAGRRISYVQHVITPSQLRTAVWYEREEAA